MDDVIVIGAGYMGGGIAQVVAQAGYRVYLHDSNPAAVNKSLGQIRWSTEKLESKGQLKDSAKAVQERISATPDFTIAAQCKWAIEAVYEDLELKNNIFKKLDNICPKETILASNTSSIPITRLASGTEHPERIVGVHFSGPVPLMPLVEVIKGDKTSDAVFKASLDFVVALNKYPIKVMKDIPGFVMNRVSSAAFREGFDLVAAGITTIDDVDTAMKWGVGWRVGPFEIADNAGLDTYLRVSKAYKELGDESFAPRPLLEKMVQAGRLGKKVNKGFYDYTPDGGKTPFDITSLK
ncbi:MAG: 3-hydroxyacyl-CoA dehydrogenase family protein [Dehalococcoidia bacterium]